MNRTVLGIVVAAAVLTALACGGKPSQSNECKVFINCYEKTKGPNTPAGSMDGFYGPMGTCWSTTQAAADMCTGTCSASTDALKGSYPDAGC